MVRIENILSFQKSVYSGVGEDRLQSSNDVVCRDSNLDMSIYIFTKVIVRHIIPLDQS